MLHILVTCVTYAADMFTGISLPLCLSSQVCMTSGVFWYPRRASICTYACWSHHSHAAVCMFRKAQLNDIKGIVYYWHLLKFQLSQKPNPSFGCPPAPLFWVLACRASCIFFATVLESTRRFVTTFELTVGSVAKSTASLYP